MSEMRSTIRIYADAAKFIASARWVRRELILLNRSLRYYAGKGGKPS